MLEIVRGNIPVYSFQLPISLLALWCELELRTSENYWHHGISLQEQWKMTCLLKTRSSAGATAVWVPPPCLLSVGRGHVLQMCCDIQPTSHIWPSIGGGVGWSRGGGHVLQKVLWDLNFVWATKWPPSLWPSGAQTTNGLRTITCDKLGSIRNTSLKVLICRYEQTTTSDVTAIIWRFHWDKNWFTRGLSLWGWTCKCLSSSLIPMPGRRTSLLRYPYA